MTEVERLRLGEMRKRIFRNFCNGLPLEEIAQAEQRSAFEAEKDILFVARKIREYRFRRCAGGSKDAAPPVQSDCLMDIRLNRLALMETLGFLGPGYLSSALILPNVQIQRIDDKSMIRDASHRINAAGNL